MDDGGGAVGWIDDCALGGGVCCGADGYDVGGFRLPFEGEASEGALGADAERCEDELEQGLAGVEDGGRDDAAFAIDELRAGK